jgi:hypothetical protein
MAVVKGIVRRKLRWVKSGINQWLINCHIAADVLFSNLKGHYPLNLIKLSCCRTAVGVGQRALSLSPHTAGDPPPLLAPGRVASSRHFLGV